MSSEAEVDATAKVRAGTPDNTEVVGILRDHVWSGLGFNCTFVDDDMRVLVGLAQRAVLAGLASDFSDDMQKRFTAASERHRAAHEKALGRPLPYSPITKELP